MNKKRHVDLRDTLEDIDIEHEEDPYQAAGSAIAAGVPGFIISWDGVPIIISPVGPGITAFSVGFAIMASGVSSIIIAVGVVSILF
ncbi:MAG TPA: hypothetical protein VMT46_04480 [Anaerolineaceae bacterium]|nr:hypothetical protein [Anaerolineaceae bacterium]